jgi:hypothetical protein
MEHRPAADGQQVAGIYRRSVMLASGRYAMLNDGMGFGLVPWKPVIEKLLGQPCSAEFMQSAREICVDGPDFDRVSFHREFNAEVVAFFRKHLTDTSNPE